MDAQEDPPVGTREVRSLQSSRLSYYRSEHEFLHYGEFSSAADYVFFLGWARERALPILILGSGSNVLFKHRRVKSLVLRNRLPREISALSGTSLQVSSSVMVAEVLKWCEGRDLDSFYYLASVPATVGGAIAMNAGRGRAHNKTIFDFVASVTVLRDGKEITLSKGEIALDYRQTPFTGQKSDLITRVIFTFKPAEIEGSPRRERVAWSKENQDHSAPNCGSVFKQFDSTLMTRLRGRGFFSARFSTKTTNWILSTGNKSWPIVWLIRFTQWLHRVKRKRAVLEIIAVD